MKFVTILSSILLLFFTTILILGVILGSDFSVKETISIEAPQAVVFRELIQLDNYKQWCPGIKASTFNPGKKTRSTVYLFGEKELRISETVQFIENQNLIIFIQNDSLTQSYIRNFTNEIRTSENPDGSTDVEWKVSYSVKPILSKLLSSVFLIPKTKQVLTDNLKALKSEIEG